jgi:tetratricopeptide (TPR) repeat protein
LIHDFKKESIPCFKKANDLDATDFRWAYFCAVALEGLNSDEAIQWYERSKILYPDYPPLLVKLGNRYLLQGNYANASATFDLVIDSDVKIPHAHLGMAKIAIENGELNHAEDQLAIAIKMAPKYREAHALLAEVYRRQGEKEKAEEQFAIMEGLPERLDLKDPVYYEMVEEGASSFWRQVRGHNFLNSGQLNKAEEEFKKALLAKPNAASHTSLGYVYQRQKRFETALDHYKAALDMDPKFSGALNNMAVIYYELGDIDMAVKMVKDALKADPRSLDGYLNLGTFYKVMGRKGEAIENFRIAHDKAPDDMRYMYQLGWLLAVSEENDLRNGKEALRLAKIVCEYSNYNNAAALDLLAAAHAENKQFEKASNAASKAYQLALREGNKKLAAEIKNRGTLYRNNKPYRE